MSQDEPRPTEAQLRAELVQLDREIREAREALTALRARRPGLHARVARARQEEQAARAGFTPPAPAKKARAAGRKAADRAPDENRDVGGEG